MSDGRFTIVTQISDGGFGITYKAIDRVNGDAPVVIKEFFPADEGVRREGLEVRFQSIGRTHFDPVLQVIAEARRQGQIKHPCVAKTEFVFTDHGTAYIAMQWIEGDTLRTLREQRPFSELFVRKVFLTVLDAILHFKTLSHRDLNYNNIMIRRADGRPVVIDFGAARPTGAGNTLLSRTPIGMSPFMPPEQFYRRRNQDRRTDIYTLAATLGYLMSGDMPRDDHEYSLQAILALGPGPLDQYSPQLLSCLDQAMQRNVLDRLRSGAEALRLLGMSRADVEALLDEEVVSNTLLFDEAEPERFPEMGPHGQIEGYEPLASTRRFQRALLQSFDTARFQPTSMPNDPKDKTPEERKIALARTEALLSILFAREIVVPAGQIAESRAFFQVFSEIIGAFDKRKHAIDQACAAAHLPAFRPFRLALEEKEMCDYVGFVQAYKFTGAPLILLQQAGVKQETVDAARARVEGFKQLFLGSKYDALSAAVPDRPAFGDFARSVRSYFDSSTSIFARKDLPTVDANEYAIVFYNRLSDESLTGRGVAEARSSLDLVKNIEADLAQTKFAGYRGNWYLFAKSFKDVWPLARAYLDTRLFVTLSQQYDVDHPVLISQEFEYGNFDHSLMLGPKFAAQLQSGDGSDLLQLSSHLSAPLDWDDIFMLFENPDFLGSVRRMNSFYYSKEASSRLDYVASVREHGALLEHLLKSELAFHNVNGELVVSSAGKGKAFDYGTYDTIGGRGTAKERDRLGAESFLAPYAGANQEHVALRIMTNPAERPLTPTARQILNYFAKPYRLLAREGL